jgi:magnesium-transporting ATPase (P-type)
MVHYHKTPELSVSSVFKLRPEELQLFFEREHNKKPDNHGEKRECLIILERVGLNDGLLDKLATDAETGIIGDVKDINRRKKFYGQNDRSLPSIRGYHQILWEQLNEFLVVLLLVFATLSLVASLWSGDTEHPYKWLESVSIYFAVLFAAMVGSFCDYGKER